MPSEGVIAGTYFEPISGNPFLGGISVAIRKVKSAKRDPEREQQTAIDIGMNLVMDCAPPPAESFFIVASRIFKVE